jgi:hypothetical protein
VHQALRASSGSRRPGDAVGAATDEIRRAEARAAGFFPRRYPGGGEPPTSGGAPALTAAVLDNGSYNAIIKTHQLILNSCNTNVERTTRLWPR